MGSKKLYENGPPLRPKQPLTSAFKEQGEDTKRSRRSRDENGLMERTTVRLGSKYAENYKGVAASGPMKPEKKIKPKKMEADEGDE